MCLVKTSETTRGRTVIDPPPRVGNFTSHAPAGVMRLPREWRREESISDDGRYVEYRYVPVSINSNPFRRVFQLCVFKTRLCILNGDESVLTVRNRRSQPRAIGYIEEPRHRHRSRSRRRVEVVDLGPTRSRSRSRRRVSDVELVNRTRSRSRRRVSDVELVRGPRGSGYVDERVARRSVSRVRY
jgi:hypothetical protein